MGLHLPPNPPSPSLRRLLVQPRLLDFEAHPGFTLLFWVHQTQRPPQRRRLLARLEELEQLLGAKGQLFGERYAKLLQPFQLDKDFPSALLRQTALLRARLQQDYWSAFSRSLYRRFLRPRRLRRLEGQLKRQL
jgi:hypothetical protein